VNLSICIPGYNRPEFLAFTLAKLHTDFPRADIIVSDDASTEDMSTVSREGVRWFQHYKNIGPFPNQREVLLDASRKYAVYCANDDYLLPEAVAAGCAFLESHPEASAYIAPCEIWDEIDQKPFWNAFKCEPTTFTSGLELFNFIISKHVWPEHVIYRTPAPLAPRTRAYWCFADLVDLLAKGPIHVSPVPFYRNLLRHPVGERVQLGNVQCLTYFDEYRAGLEVLAYGLFGDVPYATRRQIHDMISAFICQRMHNASVLYARHGHMAEAEMLRKRIAIASPVRDAA
jgi:glycosyltransferase involved in cell wall biosynthesis